MNPAASRHPCVHRPGPRHCGSRPGSCSLPAPASAPRVSFSPRSSQGGPRRTAVSCRPPPFKAPPPQSPLTSHWPRATAQRGTSRVWPRPSLCSPVTSPGPLVNLSCSPRVTPTPRSPRAPGPPRGGFCNPVTRRGLHRVLPLCVAFTVCCASLPVGG